MRDNILIINFDFLSIEKYLAFFEKYNPKKKYKVLSFIKNDLTYKNLFYANIEDKIFPDDIENFQYEEVYILSNKDIVLPISIYYMIFTNKLKAVWQIKESNNKKLYDRMTYEPFKKINKKIKNIIVFPGPMVPLTLGSHQRVFSFVLLLNINKIYTDILLTGGNDKDNEILKKLMLSIAPNVYIYKNTKRQYPFLMKYRKKIEMFVYNQLGKKHLLSDLYSERKFIKPTFSAKKTLARIVKEKNYKNIIINYAWMIDVIEHIPEVNKYNLICDTHDVQFIRNETQNKGILRLFVSSKREKKLEVEQLNKMNKILAISKSDYETFRKIESLKNKTLQVLPSFEYIYNSIQENISKNYIFGFIGTNMKANLLSLEYILNIWPKIIEIFPDAKLKIAGSICKNEQINYNIKLDSSIEFIGYVNSLKLFYRDIDFLINPVIVKGGLNFKNAECIMSGKFLITNKMGGESLFEELLTFENVEDIIKFLTVTTRSELIEYRKSFQEKMIQEFSNKKFLNNIKEALE